MLVKQEMFCVLVERFIRTIVRLITGKATSSHRQPREAFLHAETNEAHI
jgi:hypothetical protein